jgi:dUTP pyrophosphatase
MPRSGLARRHGVTLANSPGVIDAGYRGEVHVILINLGPAAYRIEPGDRVAQLVVTPIDASTPIEVDELPTSESRGGGGFGSSGR